jgi:hypothetical protein
MAIIADLDQGREDNMLRYIVNTAEYCHQRVSCFSLDLDQNC